jgi:hypothetical protein
MLAPEAFRAVIGVTITPDFRATVFTGEVFDPALEFAAHGSIFV